MKGKIFAVAFLVLMGIGGVAYTSSSAPNAAEECDLTACCPPVECPVSECK